MRPSRDEIVAELTDFVLHRIRGSSAQKTSSAVRGSSRRDSAPRR
jgi:hypothetical protein